MAKPKISKTGQVLLVILVAVAAAWWFLNSVYDPLVKEIGAAVREHNNLVKKTAELRAKPLVTKGVLQSIRDLSPKVEEMEMELNALREEKLAPREAVDGIMLKINEIASNNGFKVLDLSPMGRKKAGLNPTVEAEMRLFERFCYHMKISGDFLYFADFLKELKKIKHFVNITNLSVVGGDAEEVVSIDMVLLI